jgi:hypothetical protein
MKEFKPTNFTIDEYDKLLSNKIKERNPELFLSKEETDKWLDETRAQTDAGYLIDSLVEEYDENITRLEKEQKLRN